MKRGKFFLVACLGVFMLFGSLGVASADTILVPVIAINQPNVTTLVSVWQRPTKSSSYLHFIYRYKDTYVGGLPNHTGTCATKSFTRAVTTGDLITFDASGVFNGGNAMFNDPDTYSGNFSLGGAGAKRAYLVITQSDASGTRVNIGSDIALGAEFATMDIAYGATWGGRGVNDSIQEGYTFKNDNDGGGVGDSIYFYSRWFSFFPPNEWTTKFFVTPIGANIHGSNLSRNVKLTGLRDRGGIMHSVTEDQDVTCTSAVGINELIDSSVYSLIENTGGWAWFNNPSYATGSIIVYKLEYVVNNPTYGGTNNNGTLLSTYDY